MFNSNTGFGSGTQFGSRQNNPLGGFVANNAQLGQTMQAQNSLALCPNTSGEWYGLGFGTEFGYNGEKLKDLYGSSYGGTGGHNSITFIERYKKFSEDELRMQDYINNRVYDNKATPSANKPIPNMGTSVYDYFFEVQLPEDGKVYKFNTIEAFPEFKGYSKDELRMVDYMKNLIFRGGDNANITNATGTAQIGASGFGISNTRFSTTGAGFGTPSAGFGQTSTGGFGQKPSTGFGQTSTGGFGQSATSNTGFGATGGGFGTTATNTGFGQNTTTSAGFGFGQTNKPAFGQSVGTGFGQTTNTATGFGQTGTTGTGFGQTGAGFGQTATSGTGFGQTGAAGTGFGQTGTTGFGQKPTTAFGQTSTSGFGQTGTSGTGFGQTGTTGTGFGQTGATGTGFGQTGTAGFGQKPTIGFGQTANTTTGFGQTGTSGTGFGQTVNTGAGTGFGQTGTTGFGQKSTTGFGQTATTGTGFGQTGTAGFGLTTNKGFGQTTTTPFGQSAVSTFGQAGTTGGFGLGQTNTNVQTSNAFPGFNNQTSTFGQTTLNQNPFGNQPTLGTSSLLFGNTQQIGVQQQQGGLDSTKLMGSLITQQVRYNPADLPPESKLPAYNFASEFNPYGFIDIIEQNEQSEQKEKEKEKQKSISLNGQTSSSFFIDDDVETDNIQISEPKKSTLSHQFKIANFTNYQFDEYAPQFQFDKIKETNLKSPFTVSSDINKQKNLIAFMNAKQPIQYNVPLDKAILPTMKYHLNTEEELD